MHEVAPDGTIHGDKAPPCPICEGSRYWCDYFTDELVARCSHCTAHAAIPNSPLLTSAEVSRLWAEWSARMEDELGEIVPSGAQGGVVARYQRNQGENMIEVGVVLGNNQEPLYWHTPAGSTAGSLPDDRRLWDVLWAHRTKPMLGFAHLHPGDGIGYPSHEDITTFAAVEAGLGRRLIWWIVTRDHATIWVKNTAPGATVHDYLRLAEAHPGVAWIDALRRLGYRKE